MEGEEVIMPATFLATSLDIHYSWGYMINNADKADLVEAPGTAVSMRQIGAEAALAKNWATYVITSYPTSVFGYAPVTKMYIPLAYTG